MSNWFRGKRILIVEDHYIVASHLETELLHHNAIPVGPAGSVGDALSLMLSTHVDAAILDVDLMTENSLPLADVLVRRGTPFVFLSKPPTNWIPTRYRDLVLNKPPELSVVAQLFSRLSETRQDNVIPFGAYRGREAEGDHPQSY